MTGSRKEFLVELSLKFVQFEVSTIPGTTVMVVANPCLALAGDFHGYHVLIEQGLRAPITELTTIPKHSSS
jgi:hypothetical protein